MNTAAGRPGRTSVRCLTGGLTFSLGLPFTADIRLNYEAYFYRESVRPALSEQDKLVVELMCRF